MRNKSLTTLGIIILFTALFFDKSWGINLFVLQLLLIVVLSYKRFTISNKTQATLLFTSLITSISSFVLHSQLAASASITSLFLYSASLSHPNAKSFYILLSSIFSVPREYWHFLKSLITTIPWPKQLKIYSNRWVIYSLSIPIIAVFILIYSIANPNFYHVVESIGNLISSGINNLLFFISWDVAFYLFIGFLWITPILYNRIKNSLIQKDSTSSTFLSRVQIRTKNSNHLYRISMGLLLEFNIAIITHSVLVISLATLIFFEVKDVWLGFNWQGQMLKAFVHEGTWLLIVSILISMLLTLFFFRGNQNFFSKSGLLKTLSYTWLSLNGLLTVSAIIRTYIYIQHFGLAYKRIALLFFLIAVIVGLYSIFKKIYYKHNAHFLYRFNSWAIYLVVVLMSLFNWDVIIAKYNLAHKNTAFVHLNFLIQLEDKALPHLIDSPNQLQMAQEKHKQMLKLSDRVFNLRYMKVDEYNHNLDSRIKKFNRKWENKSWLEWNPSDYCTYELLKNYTKPEPSIWQHNSKLNKVK